MAGETETVSLNLDGSFASSAGAFASGADKMSSSLDHMGASAAKAESQLVKLRAASKSAGGLGDGVSKGFGGSVPTALMGSLQQGGFAKLVGGIGKLFGDNAAAGVVKGASALAEVSDKVAPFAPLLGVAGDLVGAGGAVVGKAAIALTAAAVAVAAGAAALLVAGAKFGIEVTDKANLQKDIFKDLGKGTGYKVALKIAADYGLNTDDAIAKVKGLLGAKFSEAEIPAFVKIAVGIDAVKGEGKGKAFLEKLENTKNKGAKANEEAIKGFAEAGIDVDSVWKAIAAKLGTSVAIAQGKVKAGAVSMKDALDAVKKVGEKQFGQVADKLGNSVEALVMKIKGAFAQLFSNLDLAPVKSVLKAVVEALSGPSGKSLGKGITELFGAVAGLFKGINAGDIKGFLGPVVGMFRDLANTINANGPGLKAFGRSLASLTLFGLKIAVSYLKGVVRFTATVGEAWEKLIHLINGGPDAGKTKAVPSTLDKVRQAITMMLSPLQTAQKVWKSFEATITGGSAKAGVSARGIGSAIGGGLVGGILAGIPAALLAAGKMASGVLGRIRAILGVASPAKAMVFVGDMMASGMAKGMDDNAAKPAKASAKMAGGAAGAAAGGAAGGGKGGAGAGGGGPTINVYLTAAPGMGSAEAAKLGGAAGDAAYEAWRKNERRFSRELQEGRAT